MQGKLSVERMCQLAGVSRAGLYRSLQTNEPVEEEMEVRSAIQQIFAEHRRRYGYRRVSQELRRRGMLVNHKRVARLMREDIVERSWTSPIDDPGFWNPKGRAPICFNAAAARSFLPRTIKKTDLILAGRTKAEMVEAVKAAVEKQELPPIEPGAMCYMLSKQGHLSDSVGHWLPHLMFFYSRTDPAAWGVGLPGSPIFAFDDSWENLTTFLVPVREWSDGTADR